MYLIQFLLPLADEAGRPFEREAFARVSQELTEAFGGVTAYLRAPAEGAWKDAAGGVSRDQVVIYEVMVPQLDRAWWRQYRATLEARFDQESILLRASAVEQL